MVWTPLWKKVVLLSSKCPNVFVETQNVAGPAAFESRSTLALVVNLHPFIGAPSTEFCVCVCVCVCFQCSVTCGQGKTTRQVLCVISDQEVNASECDPDDRPTTAQDCAMSQCPSRSSESRPLPSSPNTSTRNNLQLPRSQSHQWRTGPWGAVRHLTVHTAASHHSGQRPFLRGAWHLKFCAKSQVQTCKRGIETTAELRQHWNDWNNCNDRSIDKILQVSSTAPCQFYFGLLWTTCLYWTDWFIWKYILGKKTYSCQRWYWKIDTTFISLNLVTD